MKLYPILLTILLSTATLPADTMTTGSKTYKGMLEGYKNGHFIFKTTDWKTIKKPRTNVKKLSFDRPYNTTYTENGKPYTAKLIKYENSKFFFKSKEGKEKCIYGVKIKKLQIEKHSPFSTPKGIRPNKQGLKTKLNIRELVKSGNLSNSQKMAIKNYITARKAYIKFQKESNAMIKQRDQLTGKDRETLINELHLRKNSEQTIINKLKISVKQLENEFAGNSK